MKSLLIADTTREERERIVREAMRCESANSCEECTGCGVLGAGDPMDLYKPYIDGEVELRDVAKERKFSYIQN